MADRFESFVSLLGDDVSVRWLITLLHVLWQGAVVGGVVAIAGRLLRGASARSRYALHSAALLSLPVCVAVTFWIVDVPVSLQSSSHLKSPADIPAKSSALPSQATAINAVAQMETTEAVDAPLLNGRVMRTVATIKAAARDNSELLSHSSLAVLSRAAPWIAMAYVVGVACFLLRLSTALWSGHRLRTPTARVTDAKLLKLIADQAERVKLKCVPVVAYCERVAVPTVVGVLRPMVLLPVPLMTGLTPDDFVAVIRHELAHIRRYDLWMNLLQRVIESLLFFHPVVWFISRRLSAEREVCCDDLVVSSGYEPMNYAGALLRMAELCAISRQPGPPALAATGDKRPLLERRIERLMNWGNTPRLQLTRAGMAGLLITLVSLFVVLGIVHTWAQAQATAGDSEPTAQSQPIRADKPAEEAKSAATEIEPKHEYAQTLFQEWQENARTDGKIPGGALGSLAVTVAKFIKLNPTDERTPKLTELLKRIDTSRDWTQAEAVVLLDDVTAIYDKLPKWVGWDLRRSIGSPIQSGSPLPQEFSGAAWGQPAQNGLRVAWLLEPRAKQYPLSTALKSRILFHNTGKKTVIFRTPAWHQPGHNARNAAGADINVSVTHWTTWVSAITIRLAPGEYAEVGAHGIAIGARNDEEESWAGWSSLRVGAWIEATEGDQVTFAPAAVMASEDAWTMPKDRKTPAELLRAIVEERINREAPLPATAADREQLIRRVTFDLFGVLPTREEIAAFTADDSPDALAALGKRLLPRVLPFAGDLAAGEIKFRVTAADPEIAKRPRVATGPGRYKIGDNVRLVVTRSIGHKPDRDRLVNSAKIVFLSPDPRAEPGKPCQITLPDGTVRYAIGWERGSMVLWVAEKGVLRSYDFTTPALVKETRIEPADITNVPQPLREALAVVGYRNALADQSGRARDHLLGWYKLADRTLIPVFKVDRTYYSVMQPGIEIPLKECPEGLEWALTPSSMVGTKIGSNEKSKEVYISIVDAIRVNHEESFISGEKQPMTRVGKPSWLVDATAPPPRSHNDFLGWYQPVWCPYIRLEIRKEGKRYFTESQILREPDETGSGAPDGEPHELSLLPDRLGFIIKQIDGVTHHIVYNQSVGRFELTGANADDTDACVSRIPLARVATPSSEKGSVRSPGMRIGIPSWN